MKKFALIVAVLFTLQETHAQSRGAAPAPTAQPVASGAASSSAGFGPSTTIPTIAAGTTPTGIAAGVAPTGIAAGAGPSGIAGGVGPSGIGQGIGVNGAPVPTDLNGSPIEAAGANLNGSNGVTGRTAPPMLNGRVFPRIGAGAVNGIRGRGSVGLGTSTIGIPSGTSSSGALGASTSGSLGRSTTGIGGVGTSEIGSELGPIQTHPGNLPSIAAGVTNGTFNGSTITTNFGAVPVVSPPVVPAVPAPGSPAAFDAGP